MKNTKKIHVNLPIFMITYFIRWISVKKFILLSKKEKLFDIARFAK